MAKKTKSEESTQTVEQYEFEPIKGFPMLTWKGKRPFTSTLYYPAQLKESYGKAADGWMNRIYWGDNLQVMSHLLKEFRGQFRLIYFDPPFDSKAEYKKRVLFKNHVLLTDQNSFEEKQYSDIWNNDEYLQFIYERLILARELLAPDGSIWFHCDWHRSHHIRCILDEVFGQTNFMNEVIWQRTDPHNDAKSRLGNVHDNIFWYAKDRDKAIYNWSAVLAPLSAAAVQEYSLVLLDTGKIVPFDPSKDQKGRRFKLENATYKGSDPKRQFVWRGVKPSPNRVWIYPTAAAMDEALKKGDLHLRNPDEGSTRCKVMYLDERAGQVLQSIWTDVGRMKGGSGYPTQKPIQLLERIIKACTAEGDLTFDPFAGSGTLGVAAANCGRKFVMSDINLVSTRVALRRFIEERESKDGAGLTLSNVNHYDLFKNPAQAKDLILKALEIEPLSKSVFDGMLDGRLVKIMPVNRISVRADLAEIIAGLDYKALEKKQRDSGSKAVEKLLLICMGHEPDLKAHLQKEVPFKIDVEICDLLRDREDLHFKRESEARTKIKGNKLLIEQFYPMNLLQKLSLQREKVSDWRELVESVLIDWNYDGAVLEPSVVDIPGSDELVSGQYEIPAGAGTIRIKITDLLSESLEVEVARG